MSDPNPTSRRWVWLDCILVFVLASALIWPLFRVEYLTSWGNIESTFIADSRFLASHWPHPRWQPLWYAGTIWDYVYPPALRYGTAWIHRTFGVIPVRAYHIYIAVLYALGIAAAYLFTRQGSGWRPGGWLAAALVAAVSPCYLFLSHIRHDGWPFGPWRLSVLIRYGEGPHLSALALMPFALLAAFVALRSWRPAALATASLLCALVVSHNFYGATSLAIFYPLLCWAVWVTHQDKAMWIRAAAIPLLAYGLTCFWLSPSYLAITLSNLSLVSVPGNLWSRWVTLGVALFWVIFTDRTARGRRDRAYLVFVTGACLFMTLNVLGNRFLDFRVVGEPERLVPEMEWTMILVGVEFVRWLWGAHPQFALPRWMRRLRWSQALAAVLVAGAFATSYRFLRHPWSRFYSPEPDYTQRVEYRIPQWMWNNMRHSRALANGSVRFWYNAWFDLQQLGGGSEQGLLNRNVVPPYWQITQTTDTKLDVLWLQAFGCDAVIVHDVTSQENYHDIVHPKKYEGVLEKIFDDGQGNWIYRIPRRWTSLARVVERSRLDTMEPIVEDARIGERLEQYVAAVERGPDSPASLEWLSSDRFRIRARVAEGQAVLAQVNWDKAWRASSGGRSLEVKRDPLGLMQINAPPGEGEIEVEFGLTRSALAGRIITPLALLLVAGLWFQGWRSQETAA